jgi:hypothetical protein
MQHFTQLGKVDVLPLLLQIERHPELWNQHTGRTAQEGSAHTEVSDIWLRWRPAAALVKPESYNEPFAELEWYPAMTALPAARAILMDIMQRVGGLALGGSLITRIPSGGQVKPHTDVAAWHAQYYRTKVYTVIKSNPNAVNWTAGESLVMEPGTVWTFDNLKEHAVYNEGADDRITMMCAIRCD